VDIVQQNEGEFISGMEWEGETNGGMMQDIQA
jgi:hypothetical protein